MEPAGEAEGEGAVEDPEDGPVHPKGSEFPQSLVAFPEDPCWWRSSVRWFRGIYTRWHAQQVRHDSGGDCGHQPPLLAGEGYYHLCCIADVTSFMMGERATGLRSLGCLGVLFLGIGMSVECSHSWGTVLLSTELWSKIWNTSPSYLRTPALMVSGPGELVFFRVSPPPLRYRWVWTHQAEMSSWCHSAGCCSVCRICRKGVEVVGGEMAASVDVDGVQRCRGVMVLAKQTEPFLNFVFVDLFERFLTSYPGK